jgi:hypothetical protein
MSCTTSSASTWLSRTGKGRAHHRLDGLGEQLGVVDHARHQVVSVIEPTHSPVEDHGKLADVVRGDGRERHPHGRRGRDRDELGDATRSLAASSRDDGASRPLRKPFSRIQSSSYILLRYRSPQSQQRDDVRLRVVELTGELPPPHAR